MSAAAGCLGDADIAVGDADVGGEQGDQRVNISNAAAVMASDQASAMTGTVANVSGGTIAD